MDLSSLFNVSFLWVQHRNCPNYFQTFSVAPPEFPLWSIPSFSRHVHLNLWKHEKHTSHDVFRKKNPHQERAQPFGSPFLLLLEIDSQSNYVFLGKSKWVSKNTRVEWQVERSKVKNMTGQDSITLPWTTRPSPLGKIRFYKEVETLQRD